MTAAWPHVALTLLVANYNITRTMGTYDGSLAADLEYPLAFLESMARVLEAEPSRTQFRYVHLSGKFVRQDQEKKLWFLEKPRKIKVEPKMSFCKL